MTNFSISLFIYSPHFKKVSVDRDCLFRPEAVSIRIKIKKVQPIIETSEQQEDGVRRRIQDQMNDDLTSHETCRKKYRRIVGSQKIIG